MAESSVRSSAATEATDRVNKIPRCPQGCGLAEHKGSCVDAMETLAVAGRMAAGLASEADMRLPDPPPHRTSKERLTELLARMFWQVRGDPEYIKHNGHVAQRIQLSGEDWVWLEVEIERLRPAAESWESYVAAQERKGSAVETTAVEAEVRATLERARVPGKATLYCLKPGDIDAMFRPALKATGEST